MVGVDVGEDFLDFATLVRQHLSLKRVDLRRLPSADKPDEMNAIAALSATMIDQIPQLRGAVVLVDSPRWPRDLDWTTATASRRSVKPPPGGGVRTSFAASGRGRELDVGLRRLRSLLRKPGRDSTLATLSMFPTPPLRYFGAHLNAATCKPHLRTLGWALFGQLLNRDYSAPSGGLFTRFMIAGFAVFRALEALDAEVYEGYPDLQFRLWSGGRAVASKKAGRTAALSSRMAVLAALAGKLGIRDWRQVKRLDEADAAILALSVSAAQQRGAISILENPHEGRFMVATDGPESRRLQHSPIVERA